ncbi:MAG: adenosylcobinamide-GDP ribazoletransferase [Gammaproteobacteria bacterium]|nr:adenosylcobinamide-GDP ribazoletransferase [Gammaproteobacteria bacterium]
MFKALLIALQFLTRLPLPKGILTDGDYTEKRLGQSVIFYPVAGLVIGALLYLVVYVCHQYLQVSSPLIIAALVLLIWVLLTGALHLDGLSDSADAWVGGYGDKDKTLAIMKDPYCGPAGVSIIVITLILKFALLTVISKPGSTGLIVVPVMARLFILFLFMTTPYVRPSGIGAIQASELPRMLAWFTILFFSIVGIYVVGIQLVYLISACLVVFFLLRQLMVNRLGGTTGDTAGAMIEILEVTALLVLGVLLK